MKELQKYIDEQNFMRKLFKEELITTHVRRLTSQDADTLYYQLEGDLSPENLACDGEISGAAMMQKKRFYDAVIRELKSLGFEPRPDCYL